jgi:hypothetical protein
MIALIRALQVLDWEERAFARAYILKRYGV